MRYSLYKCLFCSQAPTGLRVAIERKLKPDTGSAASSSAAATAGPPDDVESSDESEAEEDEEDNKVRKHVVPSSIASGTREEASKIKTAQLAAVRQIIQIANLPETLFDKIIVRTSTQRSGT